jgi:ubiquinol-cytochrome c reductase cytochrome b subunit
MFGAILILLVLPVTDRSLIRGNSFKILSKFFFFLFVFNFILLGNLGQLHVEPPFINLGKYCTVLYFSYFLIIMPVISYLENILFLIGRSTSSSK